VTRTRASTLVILAAIGAGVGFLLQVLLASGGMQRYRPELALALSLLFLAGIVIALAVPIRRATRGKVRTRIDPFHATRVVLFAKASSIAGALLTGGAAGLLAEVLVRSGGINTDSLLRTIAVLAGAVALLVAGLVGEWLCTVPPGEDDRDGDPAGSVGV
jgi:membrane protease YdiL (CAAX protease family)